MKIIDISWPITNSMTEYKNRSIIDIKPIKEIKKDGVSESIVSMHLHTGTHVDAPAHVIEGGLSIERLPLSQYIGPCRVLDLTHIEAKITATDLKLHALQPDEIVLLKTKNSFLHADAPFDPEFVYLEESGARYCVEKKIKTVGIDYLGIERNQPAHETHQLLLKNQIGIVEGLRLEHATPGNYFFVCLPLFMPGVESCSARAILLSTTSTFHAP